MSEILLTGNQPSRIHMAHICHARSYVTVFWRFTNDFFPAATSLMLLLLISEERRREK